MVLKMGGLGGMSIWGSTLKERRGSSDTYWTWFEQGDFLFRKLVDLITLPRILAGLLLHMA